MAEYAARLDEIDRQIEDARRTALEGDDGTGASPVLASFIRMKAAVTAYGDWRDRAFNDGLPILMAASDGTAEKYHRRWYEHYLRAATDAFRTFSDLQPAEPSAAALAATIASQESITFDIVAGWTFARLQGQVRERLRTLERERAGVESKWAETVGQDERQDGQIAGLRVQVLESFRTAVQQVRGWGPRFEEAARTFAVGWEGSERPSPDPSFAEPVRAAVETLATLSRTLDESVRSALPMYAAEQVVHEIFAGHRLAVSQLLEDLDPDDIDELFDDAQSEAEASLARATRDGQRADLKRLLEKVSAEVEPCVKEYRSAFEAFVAHFDGRYTGRISDATAELLLEAEFFNQFWKDVEGLNLPGEIRSAGEAVARCVDIDLDRMTPEHRQQFEEVITSRLRDLQDQIRSLDASIWERMKLQFWLVPREAMREKLRSSKGYEK